MSQLMSPVDWIQRWRHLLHQNVHLYEGLIFKEFDEDDAQKRFYETEIAKWHLLLESQFKTYKNN